MKKSSKKILKSILLSSVFSLFGTNSNAAQVVTVAEGESDSFNEKDILSSLGNKIQKNVLKMGHNGEDRIPHIDHIAQVQAEVIAQEVVIDQVAPHHIVSQSHLQRLLLLTSWVIEL